MRKNVLVTGSSRGIGRAIAHEFLLNDYNVIINSGKSLDELDKTFFELQALLRNENKSAKVFAVPIDVSDYEQCQELFAKARSLIGAIDILVNNAGVSHFKLFQDMTPSEINFIMTSNLNSVINCSHCVIRDMFLKRSGVILNISSVFGEIGASCESVYSCAKGGVNAFTKSLAKELGSVGIRVNAIACGVIETQMNSRLTKQERDVLASQISLARIGRPEDVAKLVLFLASDLSSYITGQVINIDGGWV